MSAETSERLATLASQLLDHPDEDVRSLAGSVLRQFEPDPAKRGPEGEKPLLYRQGFWDGLWARQR